MSNGISGSHLSELGHYQRQGRAGQDFYCLGRISGRNHPHLPFQAYDLKHFNIGSYTLSPQPTVTCLTLGWAKDIIAYGLPVQMCLWYKCQEHCKQPEVLLVTRHL